MHMHIHTKSFGQGWGEYSVHVQTSQECPPPEAGALSFDVWELGKGWISARMLAGGLHRRHNQRIGFVTNSFSVQCWPCCNRCIHGDQEQPLLPAIRNKPHAATFCTCHTWSLVHHPEQINKCFCSLVHTIQTLIWEENIHSRTSLQSQGHLTVGLSSVSLSPGMAVLSIEHVLSSAVVGGLWVAVMSQTTSILHGSVLHKRESGAPSMSSTSSPETCATCRERKECRLN